MRSTFTASQFGKFGTILGVVKFLELVVEHQETNWRHRKSIGRKALKEQHVMEEVRGINGDHQALLQFPSYGCESTADGPVWGETFYRWDTPPISYVQVIGELTGFLQAHCSAHPNFSPKNFPSG